MMNMRSSQYFNFTGKLLRSDYQCPPQFPDSSLSDLQGVRLCPMTLAIIALFFDLPTNVHWHLLKVNSIRSSPCHRRCQLGQEYSDFVIFGTQGVRKLPKKNWRNINMSAYFDQKWLRSRVFCSQPTSCNILPQRSQTRNSRGAFFALKLVKVSPVFASAIFLLISIATFSPYHDIWGWRW